MPVNRGCPDAKMSKHVSVSQAIDKRSSLSLRNLSPMEKHQCVTELRRKCVEVLQIVS